MVGGLIFSQTLTLFVTPVFYLYMEKLRRQPNRGGDTPSGDFVDELARVEREEHAPAGAMMSRPATE